MVKHDLLARGIASIVGTIVNGLQTTVNNLAITVANHATYSTTEEIVIGTYDGKPLYRKALLIPALSATSGSTSYPHGIANIEKILNGNASHATNGTSFVSIPFVAPSSTDQIAITLNTTNVVIIIGKNLSAYNATIFLEYTKTTD